ncbi:MAG: type II and III secretion system protein family protein [Phycisphaerae bacterium]|nr:type II and III secretion system protein family protein [Phycisphaerae bacterium]
MRLRRLAGRAFLLFLLYLSVLPLGVATDVLGSSQPVPSPMMSSVRVVANQAMSVFGDHEAPRPAAERTVVANRPVTLGMRAHVEGGHADANGDAEGDDPASVESPGRTSTRLTGVSGSPRAPGDLFGGALGDSLVLACAGSEDQPGIAAGKQGTSDTLIASVSIETDKAERITVAKGSTVTIELKSPVDRVESRDPEIADVVRPSRWRIVILGKGYGSTQLVLWVGEEQRVFNVTVEMDLGVLHALIKSISPNSRVQLHSVNGTIVLRGSVPDAETAAQVADLAALVQGGAAQNQLKVAGVQQTMLRVVVAEVNREALRQLGVNWAIGGSDLCRDFFFANNVGQINPTVFSSSGLTDVLLPRNLSGQMTYSVAATANSAATNVTFGFPRAEFQMFLNALRENRLSRVLAEPNLVAISGQTATFLAGGEVPVPVAQAGSSTGAITVEYREFGVRLGFTPTVVAGQIIRLHVMSEVSEAIPGQQIVGGFPLYTFNTRRVESTIECGNGQTFAIAGLLSERVRAVASKIPGLGDIPVLGALFSSTNYQKDNTELVVLVTPQLVEPLDPQQVPPPPGSLMTEPNDFELYTLQKLEGTPKAPVESEGVPREHAPVNTRPAESTTWATSQLALRGPWGLADSGNSEWRIASGE